MFGSTILDVAIGMCLIYLLFSLICSAVNELLEGFAKNRAADLERGIRELLSHEDGDAAVEKLYNHPLIYSLFSGAYKSAAAKKWWHPSGNLPSYIPSRSFALAIMDLALPGTDSRSSGVAADVLNLRSGVLAAPILNDKTKRALVTLIDAANGDAVKARENIEGWFNSAMDRVSGWYKRRTQIIITVFALLFAGAVNVDSVLLVNTLATDKSVRDSLVSAAREYAKQTANPTPGSHPVDRLNDSIDRLEARGLQIGWSDPRRYPRKGSDWLIKVIGWILTASAASLGAPFWFDTLNKFIVVRSTVKPHEKSREEPSKD